MPPKINVENTNYNNLCLILTDSPLQLSSICVNACMYSVCVGLCMCVCVTFFSFCCLNRQSLRYSLQNCTHAILISQNMEARAPTPSLTPSIIDYARLQISLEKEPKTQRQRERGRERSQQERRTWKRLSSQRCGRRWTLTPALKQQ